ncbi:hypothetical protein [Haloactinomyces albus]|uniref:Secreted protein n=1 Tax=Haloactinomyces albus TaxID=1352928 RepID=A0AAE4CLB8_9ACTN|nr:hypothetical protein [Haloactinomyces albus]MDR7302110.1 hypothetical protein [Haloactinomyces albus]
MGIPAWVWFVVAVVAIVAGVTLLITDRMRRTSKNRERRRWATLRGWQFAESDQVLPTRWKRGALAQYSGGMATDIVAGSTFTSDGRRQVSVFDLTVGGSTVAVLAGVRCRRPVPATIELWLPEVPVPQESELDLLGPVGSRYAFVTDVAAARPLVTPAMVDAAEEVGGDVTVVWMESDWVLAAAEPGTDPSRLESLLRALGGLVDVLDPFEVDPNEQRASERPAGDMDLVLAEDPVSAEAPGPAGDAVLQDGSGADEERTEAHSAEESNR